MRGIVVVIVLVLATRFAAADALAGCPVRAPLALGTTLAADLHTTYELPSGLRVCVDKAVYPYAARRGHRLFACFVAAVDRTEHRFCGEGNTVTEFRGHRIHVTLRTPRHVGSSEVWLRVEIVPSGST